MRSPMLAVVGKPNPTVSGTKCETPSPTLGTGGLPHAAIELPLPQPYSQDQAQAANSRPKLRSPRCMRHAPLPILIALGSQMGLSPPHRTHCAKMSGFKTDAIQARHVGIAHGVSRQRTPQQPSNIPRTAVTGFPFRRNVRKPAGTVGLV